MVGVGQRKIDLLGRDEGDTGRRRAGQGALQDWRHVIQGLEDHDIPDIADQGPPPRFGGRLRRVVLQPESLPPIVAWTDRFALVEAHRTASFIGQPEGELPPAVS
jgi:hypothetical protein